MNVVIIGDIMLDINYNGISTRLAPEAPIPIINVNDIVYKFGGGASVANNFVTLGINTFIISVVGNDEYKNILFNKFIENNISIEYLIIDNNRKTTVKNRTFIDNRIVGRFDIETTSYITNVIENKIINYFKHIIANKKISAVVFSDYMKGVLTENVTMNIIKIANENNINIYVDPKDKNFKKYIGVTLIKPNKSEAEIILNTKINNDDISLENACTELLEKIKCEIVLLTLSENGLIIKTKSGVFKHIFVNNKKSILDVTGAGDTVLSSFIYFYLEGHSLIDSAEFANYCGQIKITHVGTYSITKIDVFKFKNIKHIQNINLEDYIKILKINNSIVFTNGCFDILHVGHILYLEEAKKLGNILIVGLNSDESIKKIKGNTRPINNIKYRIKQLESLTIVDYIVVFNEDTPLELLKIIKPNVLVKGGDYDIKNIIGKEYANETKILHFEEGISSTHIITMLSQEVS